MEIHPEPVDIVSLCERATQPFQAYAVDKGISLSFECSLGKDEIPSTLMLDGLHMRQICFNLLSNALKVGVHVVLSLRRLLRDALEMRTCSGFRTGSGRPSAGVYCRLRGTVRALQSASISATYQYHYPIFPPPNLFEDSCAASVIVLKTSSTQLTLVCPFLSP